MLPVEHRLRQEKDIKTLLAKGKGVFDDVVGLKMRSNGGLPSRFAVVVGTKVSKRAVVRNLLRRRIRAVVEDHISEIPVGFDVIMLVRPLALKLKPGELAARTLAVLHRGRLLK